MRRIRCRWQGRAIAKIPWVGWWSCCGICKLYCLRTTTCGNIGREIYLWRRIHSDDNCCVIRATSCLSIKCYRIISSWLKKMAGLSRWRRWASITKIPGVRCNRWSVSGRQICKMNSVPKTNWGCGSIRRCWFRRDTDHGRRYQSIRTWTLWRD